MEEKRIGPRTSRKDFFLHHVDLDLPALAGIREALSLDDVASAEHIFANAMRENP